MKKKKMIETNQIDEEEKSTYNNATQNEMNE